MQPKIKETLCDSAVLPDVGHPGATLAEAQPLNHRTTKSIPAPGCCRTAAVETKMVAESEILQDCATKVLSVRSTRASN